MKKIYLFLLPLFLFGLMPTIINAQNHCGRVYFGANYTYLHPQNELAENGFHPGHGVSFEVLYDLTPDLTTSNVHLGGRINGLVGKQIKNNTFLAEPANAEAEIAVYNTVFDFEGVARWIFLSNNRFSPYVEGYGGLRLVSGQESIELQDFNPEFESKTSEQQTGSSAFVYGGSVGLLIKLNHRIDFDIRVNYDKGSTIEFIDMDSYELTRDGIAYEFSESPIDNLGLHVGFRFQINGCDYEQDNTRNNRSNRTYRKQPRKGKTPKKKKPSIPNKS